jgi:hypothetical protein
MNPVENPPPRYGIIRHRPRSFDEAFKILFYPDICFFQEKPEQGVALGKRIRVLKPLWDYLRKINDDRGYDYTQRIGAMWINDKKAERAERIGCGGNFVNILEETETHYRIESFDYRERFDTFDPNKINWFETPWLVWKAVTIHKDSTEEEPRLMNPTVKKSGADVYIPYIHDDNPLWVHKQYIELFPEPPEGVQYVLRGANVYDQYGNSLLTSNLTPKKMDRQFHTDWFKLQNFGVLAPDK